MRRRAREKKWEKHWNEQQKKSTTDAFDKDEQKSVSALVRWNIRKWNETNITLKGKKRRKKNIICLSREGERKKEREISCV